MKITALRLFNVKRFAGRGVAIEGIGDGVNVLCAANEVGKSTSFEALHALFFQPHSGTPGAVQALRPYSAGNPLVEADIETATGRFRITKQYYGGRSVRVSDLASGRLVAQADEAENFISALVKGGTAGPAGLLWVRQGITGIEARSRSEEDREKQIRASLLESVQGEVEAITGGRRMAAILSRTQDALSELVTPTGQPRKGGRFHEAIRHRDAMATREAKLGADVRALRDFLERRNAAVTKLAEVDSEDDRRERQKAIEKAQADFESAKAHQERQRAVEAELRLARERWNTADRGVKAFLSALEHAQRLRIEIDATGRRHGEIATRRSEAVKAVETARRDADAAEKEHEEAHALLARLDAALRMRDAAERLGELAERLAKAEITQRDIDAAAARLVHMKVPPKAVDELQELEVQIARQRALVEAALPSATIVYEHGMDSRVLMDGASLRHGQPRTYDATAELLVPGVGTITLHSSRSTGSAGLLEKVEARRLTLLASMNVADLAAARERQVQAERTESAIAEMKGRLSGLAPDGLAKLREAVAALPPPDEEALELKGNPDVARLALAGAETRRRVAREAAQLAAPLRQRADDAFVEVSASIARLEGENAQVVAVLGPEADRAASQMALMRILHEAEERLEEAKADSRRLDAAGVDLASVEAGLRRLRSVVEASGKEIQELRNAIVDFNAHIRARSDEAVEEDWRESVEALDAANARVATFEREVSVLHCLMSALEAARSQARELYLKPVMAELKPLLGLLFDDASIVFDEKTLLPQTISRNGLNEDVERLSGGMREQLSVLTRLAFARLLARDGNPAPVILDDALVYSDDDRIERMFDALHRQSNDQQIIVFSCRQRAFQRLGGNILKMSDWYPS